MPEHILLQHAKRKKYSAIPEMPEGAYYDTEKGYWMNGFSALVSPASKYGTQVSKKCDQETGEDQKGE